jgi:uncharacterized protein (TIGR02145 family)
LNLKITSLKDSKEMEKTLKQRRLTFTKVFILILLLSVSSSCKEDEEESSPQETTSIEISGKTYSTAKIGSQTWTIENYAGPGGIPYNDKNEKPEYGKYYSFEEAKAVVVPTGWRIPSIEDYIKLGESQGVVFTMYRATAQNQIKKLASTTNWRNIPGNNSSGFNAYPAGYSFRNSAPMDGDISEFWTSDGKTMSIQEGAKGIDHNMMFYDNSADNRDFRFNLRFVKDN